MVDNEGRIGRMEGTETQYQLGSVSATRGDTTQHQPDSPPNWRVLLGWESQATIAPPPAELKMTARQALAPPEETLLFVLAGATSDQRAAAYLVPSGAESFIELRQQSWADRVGWFTQSSVRLSPEQIGELRSALGTAASTARGSAGRASSANWSPRLVHADSA